MRSLFRAFRVTSEPSAHTRAHRTKSRVLRNGAIRLYWWQGVPNLGDCIAETLVAGLSGRPVQAVGKRDRAKMIACGSTIHRARRGDVVWGAGSLHPEQVPASRHITACAVRGPLTRQILIGAGIDCPEVYGDPALLLPRVIPLSRATAPRYSLGVIPHYQDKGRVAVEDARIAVLDIQGGLESFLGTLIECERIVSSSLHGVIFAEAYGIPAGELRIGDDVRGAAHKFEDYFLGTQRERPEPLTLETMSIDRPWTLPIIDPALATSFPFPRADTSV